MKLDQFNNPIFNEADIFDALYLGHQTVFSEMLTEENFEILKFAEISEIKFSKLDPSLYNLSVNDYDKQLQSQWFMPAEYYNINITEYCIAKCKSTEEVDRVTSELLEYYARNMQPLLQWLIYFVDTCKTHNIVWGVGRGSSVASFVLYLLQVHKIDSIKYNLDWHDFLR